VIPDDRGEERQEDELAGRGAGGEEAHREAAASREPAVHDRGAEHHGHHPAAGADQEAPHQHELPRPRHLGGQGDAGGEQPESAERGAPDAQPLHEAAGKRPHQSVEEDVQRDRERDGRAGPAELLLQRHDQDARRGADPRAREEREEGHGEDDPRGMRAAAGHGVNLLGGVSPVSG
jgi:hypothetical protein